MRCSAACLVLALAAAPATADESLTRLHIGAHTFKVERASTPAERARGLMGRTRLAANGGMLFVFETTDHHCFWMHNTPLPLSIAFIDEAGRIVALADMAPRSDALHCPPVPVRYALEVAQGGFARRGITAGVQVDGLPR